MKRNLLKKVIMFFIGYCLYVSIEVTYRNYSFPLMGIVGGIIFLLLDQINNKISWDVDILLQGTIGSLIITFFEYIIGKLFLNGVLPVMWDYSNVPLNFNGVICLPFSIIWLFLSILAIFLADAINYYIFKELPIPYYKCFGKKILQFKER